jgi:monofunctional glycosyltransferase
MWFFISTIAVVFIYKWINPPITIIQLSEKCDCPQGSTYSKGPWADSEEISLHMKLAVVASEDNNFMKHGGIDWDAVEKAKKYNDTTGKKKGKRRGASTISQQTAKNVFLWKGEHTITRWMRKGFEVYFTYLIEWIWGKDRIMEVYLNVIEMGPCKFGVGAAAKDYFNTSASKLTREQAALIAGCLPNPKKYLVAKPGSYLKRRQGQIVRLMRLIGDNYFELYETEKDKKEIEIEEKEREKKIESLPKEDLPEKIEESDENGTHQPDEQTEPIQQENSEPEIIIPADTTGT